MDYALTVNGISKSYGKFKVLDNLSLKVPKGSIYGIIGKNGAGKTTLIRIICGLQAPTGGSYTLYGTESTDKSISKARKRIGAVVETPSIYMDMTAEQNLRQQFTILGNPDYSQISSLLKLVGLENTGKKKAGHFSLGMKQRLGIAVAMAGNPDFLILDEPVNGLDPQGIVEIRELILKLNREMGITIFISSHILDELSKIATYYGFVNNGHIVKEISAGELEKNSRKSSIFEVTDINSLIRYLVHNKMEYTVINDKSVQIYSEININDIVLNLSSEKCNVLSIKENDETLESYFINLVGGTE